MKRVQNRYRGIDIKPVPKDHICYRACGDRWEFWNEKVQMMYMRPTIIDCCKEIDRLAEEDLIELPKNA